jgi:hypothetical protein
VFYNGYLVQVAFNVWGKWVVFFAWHDRKIIRRKKGAGFFRAGDGRPSLRGGKTGCRLF